jgi:hypothetical protein
VLIETIVTLFIVGFVAVAGYGHVLVARALLGHKDTARIERNPGSARRISHRVFASLRRAHSLQVGE